MQEFFGFRNFRQFERTRREIKLPYDLLNDIRFRQLPDARKAHLICLLLLSARMNNLMPNSPVKLEMDHSVPVSKGGKTEESNLQTLCRRCNRAKSRKLVPGF